MNIPETDFSLNFLMLNKKTREQFKDVDLA